MRTRTGFGGGLVAVAASLVFVVALPVGVDQRERTGPRSEAPAATTGPTLDRALAHELTAPSRSSSAEQARPGRTAVLPRTHTVAPGDTLGTVGQRYGSTAGDVARANAVGRRDTIHPGQTLVIPRNGPASPETPEEAAAADLAVERLLLETAAAHGLDGALVQAVAWRESRWQQRVVSHRGAVGILQVRPRTGKAMAGHLGRDVDLYDVADNIAAGSAYLAVLLNRYDGDLRAALGAYHQGPQSLAEQGPIPATQRYVADVLALRDRFAVPAP